MTGGAPRLIAKRCSASMNGSALVDCAPSRCVIRIHGTRYSFVAFVCLFPASSPYGPEIVDFSVAERPSARYHSKFRNQGHKLSFHHGHATPGWRASFNFLLYFCCSARDPKSVYLVPTTLLYNDCSSTRCAYEPPGV